MKVGPNSPVLTRFLCIGPDVRQRQQRHHVVSDASLTQSLCLGFGGSADCAKAQSVLGSCKVKDQGRSPLGRRVAVNGPAARSRRQLAGRAQGLQLPTLLQRRLAVA